MTRSKPIDRYARRALTSAVAAGMVLSGAVGGVTPAAAAPSALAASVGGVPGVAVPTIAWAACADWGREDFQCATVALPFDYTDPSGRSVKIAVLKVPAAKPAERIGTMFVNPGGPGSSGVDFAADAPWFFSQAVRDRFDVVGFDPRGLERSEPGVRCFGTADARDRFEVSLVQPFPVTYAEAQDRIAWNAELGRRCAKRLGTVLEHVSTTEIARDMDVLRAAVGDAKLTYYGASYGTYLGAIYANLFPGNVRALAFDGVIDPARYVSGPEGTIIDSRSRNDRSAYQTLLRFFQQCDEAGPQRCALAGNAKARYDKLLAGLKSQPMRLPASDGTAVQVTYAQQVSTIVASLYNPQRWPQLASALASLEAPTSATPTVTLRSRLRRAAEQYSNQGTEVYNASTCGDTDNPRDPAVWSRVARIRNQVAGDLASYWAWVTSACASWPAKAADRYTGPWNTKTAAPILLTNTRFDPATSYFSATMAQKHLGNARLLTVEGYGHVSYARNRCAAGHMDRYLIDGGTLPPAGTVCGNELEPFPAQAPPPSDTPTARAEGVGVPPPLPPLD